MVEKKYKRYLALYCIAIGKVMQIKIFTYKRKSNHITYTTPKHPPKYPTYVSINNMFKSSITVTFINVINDILLYPFRRDQYIF